MNNNNYGYGIVAVFSISSFVSLALVIALGSLAISEGQYIFALLALFLTLASGVAVFSGVKFYQVLQQNKKSSTAATGPEKAKTTYNNVYDQHGGS